MKADPIHSLTDSFEAHEQETESGVLYWLARDIQHLLGYTEWWNFTAVISKEKTACEVSGHAIFDRFVDINKTIKMPARCGEGSRSVRVAFISLSVRMTVFDLYSVTWHARTNH